MRQIRSKHVVLNRIKSNLPPLRVIDVSWVIEDGWVWFNQQSAPAIEEKRVTKKEIKAAKEVKLPSGASDNGPKRAALTNPENQRTPKLGMAAHWIIRKKEAQPIRNKSTESHDRVFSRTLLPVKATFMNSTWVCSLWGDVSTGGKPDPRSSFSAPQTIPGHLLWLRHAKHVQ